MPRREAAEKAIEKAIERNTTERSRGQQMKRMRACDHGDLFAMGKSLFRSFSFSSLSGWHSMGLCATASGHEPPHALACLSVSTHIQMCVTCLSLSHSVHACVCHSSVSVSLCQRLLVCRSVSTRIYVCGCRQERVRQQERVRAGAPAYASACDS